MALVSLLFRTARESGSIGTISLDATIGSTVTYVDNVTSYPVESGSELSDNIDSKPVGLSLTGVITNSPVEVLYGLFGNTSTDRVKYALDQFKALRAEKTTVTIVTELDVYENMFISTLTIPRYAGLGDILKFSCTAKEVNFVSPSFTVIPNTEVLSASSTANQGSQSNTSTDEATEEKTKSMLKSAFDSVTDLF